MAKDLMISNQDYLTIHTWSIWLTSGEEPHLLTGPSAEQSQHIPTCSLSMPFDQEPKLKLCHFIILSRLTQHETCYKKL